MSGKNDPMTLFLSEESLARHREYARNLRLKYSILQKSETTINSLNIREIPWQKLSPDLAAEAFSLLADITLHDVFFSSFTENRLLPLPSDCRDYKSSADLLNRLYRLAYRDTDGGFLVAFGTRRGIGVKRIFPPYRELLSVSPTLAVDLYEHSYFSDYGFDRSRYLISALAQLDLSRLA